MTEELWSGLGHTQSIFLSTWPLFDAQKIVDEDVTVAVQVNGRVRGEITIARDLAEDEVKEVALGNENVKQHLEGKMIRKVIVVPGKIVSIVVS